MENDLNKLKTINKQLIADIENKEKALSKLTKDKEELRIELNGKNRQLRQIREQYNDLYNESKYHSNLCGSGDQAGNKIQISTSRKKVQTEFKNFYPREQKLINELTEQNQKLRMALFNSCQEKKRICEKFLKMKRTKDALQNELEQVKDTYNKTINDLSTRLQNCRLEKMEIFENYLPKNASDEDNRILMLMKEKSTFEHEAWTLKYEMAQLQHSIRALTSNQSNVTLQTNNSSIALQDLDIENLSLIEQPIDIRPRNEVLAINGCLSAPDRIETHPFQITKPKISYKNSLIK